MTKKIMLGLALTAFLGFAGVQASTFVNDYDSTSNTERIDDGKKKKKKEVKTEATAGTGTEIKAETMKSCETKKSCCPSKKSCSTEKATTVQ
jgi:hypothetical protein